MRPAALLALLVLFLILLVMASPLALDARADAPGCETAFAADTSAMVQDSCEEDPGPSRTGFCSGDCCPAGHCAAIPFLPSSRSRLVSIEPAITASAAPGNYASHLSAPPVPPPIRTI